MAALWVIGYGNRVRGDDAFGPKVAERVVQLHPEVGERVLILDALLPELVPVLAPLQQVLFIDAAADLIPGQLGWRRIGPGQGAAGIPGGHQLNPAGLLQMTQCLYGSVPDAWVFCVGLSDLKFSHDQLSVPVEAVFDTAVTIVWEVLNGNRPLKLCLPI